MINYMRKKINIIIKPTNNCNMRCRHCYHEEKGYDIGKIEISKIERMYELLSEEYDFISVLWHGGEPLLMGKEFFKKNQELQKKIITRKNVVFENNIQTNGTLIDEDWILFFKENNFKLGISFDGPFNNDLRFKTETVENVLEKLKIHNIKFGVLSIVTSKSIYRLFELYDWFNKRNIGFKFNPIFESGEARYNTELLIDSQIYIDCYVEFFKRWLTDSNCQLEITEFENYLTNKRTNCSNGSCIYKWLCMDSIGDIYQCGRPFSKEYCYGNISDIEKIDDLYKSDGFNKLIKNAIHRRRFCIDNCSIAGLCQGGCNSALVDVEIGDIFEHWDCKTKIGIYNKIVPIIDKFKADLKNNEINGYNKFVLQRINRKCKN